MCGNAVTTMKCGFLTKQKGLHGFELKIALSFHIKRGLQTFIGKGRH